MIKSTAAWVGLGWLGMTLWSAVGARLAPAHVLPDAGIVVIVFLALRREPIAVAAASLLLGYLAGRQALAPVGLHEVASLTCAIAVYVVAGSLAGSGALFFALTAGGAVGLYHLVIYILSWLFGEGAGFTGWPTAALVPSGFLTALVALASYRFMLAVERRLSAESREELSWR